MSVSVCLSVCLWQIPIPIYRALRSRCMRARGKGSSPGRVERSSRAMLATTRRSCLNQIRRILVIFNLSHAQRRNTMQIGIKLTILKSHYTLVSSILCQSAWCFGVVHGTGWKSPSWVWRKHKLQAMPHDPSGTKQCSRNGIMQELFDIGYIDHH